MQALNFRFEDQVLDRRYRFQVLDFRFGLQAWVSEDDFRLYTSGFDFML